DEGGCDLDLVQSLSSCRNSKQSSVQGCNHQRFLHRHDSCPSGCTHTPLRAQSTTCAGLIAPNFALLPEISNASGTFSRPRNTWVTVGSIWTRLDATRSMA